MPFFRRKRRSISTEAFKENINVLIEEYKPEQIQNRLLDSDKLISGVEVVFKN